jgi:hypothetical protein
MGMEAHPARTLGLKARKRERVRRLSLVDWPVYPCLTRLWPTGVPKGNSQRGRPPRAPDHHFLGPRRAAGGAGLAFPRAGPSPYRHRASKHGWRGGVNGGRAQLLGGR